MYHIAPLLSGGHLTLDIFFETKSVVALQGTMGDHHDGLAGVVNTSYNTVVDARTCFGISLTEREHFVVENG